MNNLSRATNIDLNQEATNRTAAGPRPGGTLSRRRFLKLAGVGTGAVVVVGGTGIGLRAVDQGVFSVGEGPAYRAWDEWQEGTPPLSLLRAAVLASSAHNTQPWLFRVSASDIALLSDSARTLGAMDPFHRELYISLGCALENVCIAAKANGLAPSVQLAPDEDSGFVARISLLPGPAEVSELYRAIPERHTNRYAYSKREMVPSVLEELRRANDLTDLDLIWFSSIEEKRSFGDLTIAATEAIVADHEQSEASHKWFRSDWDDLQRHKDGLSLDAAGLSETVAMIAKVLPSPSLNQANATFLKSTRDTHVPTAAAFGVIAARDQFSRVQQLEAGRFWQRLHLMGTAMGIAMQPLNQAVERADRERRLSIAPRFTDALDELLPEGWHALMPFRAGYPEREPNRSPRRPAEEVVQV